METILLAHGQTAQVWLLAELRENGYDFQAIRIGLGAHSAELRLGDRITIPAVLTQRDDAGLRLRSPAELEAEASAALRRAALRHRAQLAETLSRPLTLDVSQHAFFGVTRIAAAAGLSASVRLVVPGLNGASDDARPLLLATAQASVQVELLGASQQRTVSLSVSVDLRRAAQQIVAALLAIDAPELPSLDLRLLRGWLPTLDFGGWADLDFRSALVRLPLPETAVHVDWSTQPTFDVRIENGRLQVSSTAASCTLRYEQQPLVALSDLVVEADGAKIAVGVTIAPAAGVDLTLPDRRYPDFPGPFSLYLAQQRLHPTVTLDAATSAVTVALEARFGRIEIRAKDDPSLVLAFAADVRLTSAVHQPPRFELTRLELIEPYPIALIAALVDQIPGELRLAFNWPLPDLPGVPVTGLSRLLERLEQLLRAALRWLARQAGDAAAALVGLAETAFELLLRLLRQIARLGHAVAEAVAIDVRLDADSYALRQIVIAPFPASTAGPLVCEALGLRLECPLSLNPCVVVDFREHWAALALLPPAAGGAAPPAATLSTNLWFAADDGAQESVRDRTVDGDDAPAKPLVTLSATPAAGSGVALVTLQHGKAGFLRRLIAPGTTPAQSQRLAFGGRHAIGIGPVAGIGDWSAGDWAFEVAFNTDGLERALPFLKKSSSDEPGLLEQYVELESAKVAAPALNHVSVDLVVVVHVGEFEAKANLGVELDVTTLQAKIASTKPIVIMGEGTETRPLFGLDARIRSKQDTTGAFPQFMLDLSDGNARLSLASEALLELRYAPIAQSGEGLKFVATDLLISRDGVDLDADVAADTPVPLAGVGTAFRFRSGTLRLRQSQIQAFTLLGSGPLPAALVGDAGATVAIAFGRHANGDLRVESASGELQKPGGILVCDSTRFRFCISALGFEFIERDGYHFYFTLTGSAEFRPRDGEMASGLLQHLSRIKILLNKVPLAGDARTLARAIEFQVPIEPPIRTSVFDIFSFELRGIGFHPNSPAFDGPAVSLSGQINFAEFGDIPSPKLDFHQLWIAPPAGDSGLPRVRCDGLGLGLSLGGALKVSGMAIAVDGKLPSLFRPNALPEGITARGFLAQGTISVAGWADMSGSMGFLELRDGDKPIRHAFFLYGQLNKLSEPIPTPVGEIYLREAGFGLGYRYTLASLQQADTVATPRELVSLLDEVTKYQGNLDDVRAWLPEPEGNRLTLAMRALLTYRTASSPGTYDKQAEEAKGDDAPPNPVLFDVVAALRSDLTFLVAVRAWLCVNYADWVNGRGQTWQSRPGLRGYMYISVPRRQFLARAVADPNGHIGEHPKLPAPLVAALKGTRWSSTLYIDESVFHQEFGWPYELGISLKDDNGNFGLDAEGGTVLRIADGALLYGIAFRAKGFAQFSGRVGNSSLGASVEARAEFALSARFIALLSARRASDSFFYGALKLDVSLLFRVAVWLSFKIWRHRIHLEARFCLELCISVAVELVLSAGSGLGGRLQASIAVRALGRSLRVGVGLSFNNGLLDETRARVERYMRVGLGAQYPDPEKGAPAPLPERQRQAAGQIGDRRVDEVAQRLEELAEPPGTPVELTISGRPLGNAAYWALLLPTRSRQTVDERPLYLLQLIPRDHSGSRSDCCNDTALAVDPREASFFVAPRIVGVDDDTIHVDTAHGPQLSIGIALPAGSLRRLDSNGTTQDLSAGGALPVGWDKVIARAEDGRALSLGQLLIDCFLDPTADGGPLTEPDAQCYAAPEKLPSDASESAERLADASRERALLSARLQREAQIEERRSGLIATIAESANRIASAGADANGSWIATEGIDARDFGLTFVLDDAALALLFPPSKDKSKDSGPPRAEFSIIGDDPGLTSSVAANLAGRVHLFNPPARHFRNESPRLAQSGHAINPSGIALSWDLESGWERPDGTTASVWHDPDCHLRHYRIERRLLNLPSAPRHRLTTTKSAGAVVHSRGLDEPTIVRADRQYVDDLADLDPNVRRALLDSGTTPLPANAADAWKAAFGDASVDHVDVLYTIVAVDNAGTEAPPVPLTCRIQRPPSLQQSLRRASGRFVYRGLPSLAGASPKDNLSAADQLPELQLVIEDAELDRRIAAGKPAAADARRRELATLELCVANESALPIGQYGIDALTDARLRPGTPAATAPPAPHETAFRLTALGNEKPPANAVVVTVVLRREEKKTEAERTDAVGDGLIDEAPQHYRLDAIDGGDWRRSLGIRSDGDVVASRLLLRPAPQGTQQRPSDWTPVDLVLRVLPTAEPASPVVASTKAAAELIDAPIEVFEHPQELSFAALGFEDIDVEAGRLLVRYPPSDAFVSRTGHSRLPPPTLLRDGARRVATRLRWNAAPTSLSATAGKATPAALRQRIGGFDLFALDAATEIAGKPAHRQARNVGRVQLLPQELAALDPNTTGDFSRVEAYYPSETLRLSGTPRGLRRHAWLSSAESVLCWPRPLVRRSLQLLPAEDGLAALFAHGRPAQLRVRLDGWPRGLDASLVSDDDSDFRLVSEATVPTAVFTRKTDSDRFQLEQVRRALISLYWRSTAADADERLSNDPDALDHLRLVVDAMRPAPSTAPPLATVEFDVSLRCALHPLLADGIDLARYSRNSDAATYRRCRRYEPVTEAAPAVNATTTEALLDELPASADPYGWQTLRALGLAQGLRLFDTEQGKYLSGSDDDSALSVLAEALAAAQRRYAGLDIGGALFVELLFKPAGLYELAAFDGGTPATASDIDDNETIALLQLSLRPLAERLCDDRAGPVRYAALFATPGALTATIQLASETALWVEAELFGHGEASGLRMTLANAALRDRLLVDPNTADRHNFPTRGRGQIGLLRYCSWDDALLPFSLDGCRAVPLARPAVVTTRHIELRALPGATHATVRLDPEQSWTDAELWLMRGAEEPPVPLASLSLRLSGLVDADTADNHTFGFDPDAAEDEPVAVLRYRAWDGAAQPFTLTGCTARVITQPPRLANPALPELPLREPFERFGALPADIAAAVAFGWQPPPDFSGTNTTPLPANALARQQRANFLGLARRRLPAFTTRDEDFTTGARDPKEALVRQQIFVARYTGWVERWFAHGLGIVLSTEPVTPIAVALATIPNPAPWRVAPDAAGRVDVLIPETDRYGHLRRYAIRPFGRYENFAEAVALAHREPSLEGALDGVVDPYAAAVIPRTEPVAAPVFLSARRADPERQTGQRPGRLLELVLARHPEESLADANRTVEAGLGLRDLNVGFWRELSGVEFLRAAHERIVDGPALPPFGPLEPFGRADATFAADGSWPTHWSDSTGDALPALAVLDARVPDLWRGAHLLRLADLPYCFRAHALAYAAAGNVVSAPSAMSIAEGYYELHAPWLAQEWEAPAARKDRPLLPPPRWSARRQQLRDDASAPASHTEITLKIPLVRLVDCMDADARRLWLSEQRPDLFLLPDPLATYDVAVDAAGASREAELEIRPLPTPTADSTQVPYRSQAVGTRLSTAAPPRLRAALRNASVIGRELQLALTLPVVAASEPSPAAYEPGNALLEAVLFTPDSVLDGALWVAWAEMAPRCSLTVQIDAPPSAADCVALAQHAEALRITFEPLRHLPSVLTLLQWLIALSRLRELVDWTAFVDRYGAGPLTIADWGRGLPLPTTDNPLRLSRADTTGWPQLMPAMTHAHRSACAQLLYAQPDLRTTAADAQWQHWIASYRARAAAPRRGVAPLHEPLDVTAQAWLAPLRDALNAQALAAGETAPLRLYRRWHFLPASPPDPGLLRAAFAAFEPRAGVEETLNLLHALERAAPSDVFSTETIELPDELPESTLETLQALGNLQDDRLVRLVVNLPPSDAELAELAASAGAADALAFVVRCCTDQLFGRGRRLNLSVCRGLCAPLDSVFVRQTGESA
ncbi:hypothetical protein [Tahibacter sp.]|uniref:hypothetical protein n=1 Tax=Tahibacter sp. TaxID=2056211 RepID=UPI0028C47D85|nr:hypothetical protein [Tahibacter sp.]